MTTPLNFGQLTYKQGMNTLVGPPVETFAKVSQALTERYWKVRQGVADTKNALSNLQVRDSDKYIVKQSQDKLASTFSETSKSDNWHRAQGDLIDAVSDIQSNEGLKLALTSKQANIKVDEEIDKAEGWTPEEKQLRKFQNESRDNQVKKDPLTGTWTGGYKGIGLGKKVNVVSKIKEWSDIADKVFKASSTDITSVGQVGQQLGISDAVGNYNGKEMTFNQFIETHRSFREEIKKEDVTKFIGSLMAADSELIESMNTENELALTKHRLQTDDTGNIVKDKETGRVILKDLDPSVVHNLIQQLPVSPYDMASRLYNSDDFALLTKDKPTGAEKAQIKELLSVYGVDKLEDIYKSEQAGKNYANFATMEILGTDKQTPSSEFIAQTYSALKINNTFNTLAKTLGNNMGYTKIIEESKLTENGSFGHLVTGVIARQKEISSTYLSPWTSTPIASDQIQDRTEIENDLDAVSVKLNATSAKLKALQSNNIDDATFNELELNVEGNKEKAIIDLQSQVTELNQAKENIKNKVQLSSMGIKEIFKEYNKLNDFQTIGADLVDLPNDASLSKLANTILLDNVNEARRINPNTKESKIKMTEANMVTDDIINNLRQGLPYSELKTKYPNLNFSKEQISEYNKIQTSYANRYSDKLKDMGIKLQSVNNLFTEQTDDPAILKRNNLVLQSVISGNVASTILQGEGVEFVKGQQMTDINFLTTLGANAGNTKITQVYGQYAGVGVGDSMFKIDIMDGGTDAKKAGSVGNITKSILVKIPTNTFMRDGLDEVIRSNSKGKTYTNQAALNDAHMQRGSLNSISIPKGDSNLLQLDPTKSWGYNAGIIQENLKAGTVNLNIGNTNFDIVKVSDGQFRFHVNTGGQPWFMEVQTAKGIEKVDLNTLTRKNNPDLMNALPGHIRMMLGDAIGDMASFTSALDSFR